MLPLCLVDTAVCRRRPNPPAAQTDAADPHERRPSVGGMTGSFRRGSSAKGGGSLGHSLGRSETATHSSLRSWRDTQLHTLVHAQQVKLDALSVPVQLGTPAVAWARVDLHDGVRVLTLTEDRVEPPSAVRPAE